MEILVGCQPEKPGEWDADETEETNWSLTESTGVDFKTRNIFYFFMLSKNVLENILVNKSTNW